MLLALLAITSRHVWVFHRKGFFTCAVLLSDGSVPGPGSDLPRRVPVRTTVAFPKEKIPELLDALRGITVRLPVVRGTVVLRQALGTDADVIVARSIASK